MCMDLEAQAKTKQFPVMHAASIRTPQFFPKQWYISQASVHLISYARYCVVYIVPVFVCICFIPGFWICHHAHFRFNIHTEFLRIQHRQNPTATHPLLPGSLAVPLMWQSRCRNRVDRRSPTSERCCPKIHQAWRHGREMWPLWFFLGPRFKLQGGSKSTWTSSESHWSEELWTVVLVF